MAADTVQQIKDKISIIDVVGSYVKLQKAGKYMRGLSPFTKEKSPSFFVNMERNSYYCFSTGQGGDVFTFIEKMEGVDFKGALKILAEKAGVEIVYEGGGNAKQKDATEKLRQAMAEAVVFFSQNMPEKSPAYEYAKKRGATDQTIKDWQLGFAPDGWRSLLEALQTKGFTNAELLGAGLIKEADGRAGTWYDRFRNRLMFPIRDSAGRTVAFTGRALDPNDQAKYLNSPETELFKKSDVLFGMDRAKDAIRTRGFAILVEGQFDLVLLHQIGFTNTIALSGTALSPHHLSLIKRYADNLMLCLDSDRAGLAASAKNAVSALAAGMRVKAVRLPDGKDPADIASETNGAREFGKRVADAQSIVEFFLSVLSSAEKDSHKLILAAEKTVVPLISAVQSPLEQEHFIGITGRALGLTPEAVRASLLRYQKEAGSSNYSGNSSSSNTGSSSASAPERPSYRPGFGSPRPPLPPKLSTVEQRRIMLLALAANFPNTDLAKRVESEYYRVIGASVPAEPIPERAIFEAGLTYGEQPSETEVSELVRLFEHAVLTEKLREVTQELRKAEATHDASAITALMGSWKTLSAQLSALS